MTTEGFVKLPRTMLEWGWLYDGNTLKVYLVLLLSANWKDGEWHGIKVKRGQIITGRDSLAQKCGLSVRQVKTALEHLKSTNDITIKTTSKFSIITLNNYDPAENINSETTNKRPTNDQPPTNERPASDQQATTIEERKEEKEIKEREEAAAPPSPPSFISSETPVTKDELTARYGAENILLYETKFDNWASKKGITDFSKMYPTIAKWLAADNVQMPHKSSFDMRNEMQRITDKYKKAED